jgi:hypothetical protein
LGLGPQDIKAARLHGGDPQECCALLRLLVFEVSREVSYQVRVGYIDIWIYMDIYGYI